MKTFLFFALLLVLSVTGSAQTISIPASNAGVSNGSISLQRKPLGAYYGFERSAFIYAPSELGMTDTVSINNIRFFTESLNTAIAANLPVKIYLKDITDTLFAAPTTPATELSGATLVFNSGIPNSSFTSATWLTLVLTTPFIHTQTKSLEVIVETNAGGTGSDYSPTSKVFRRNDADAKRFQYWQQDNTPPTGAGTLDTLRPNIQFDYTQASMCSGTPFAGGGQASDSAVCVNSDVDLALSGSSVAALITYQWQISPDGINYTDVSGANSANYTHTMTAPAWFRGIVSCGSNADTSTVIYVNLLLPTYCYCHENIGGGCSGYSIDSLSIETTSFHPSVNGCENITSTHYSSYAYSTNPNFTTTLSAGQTYTITIRQTGNNITSLWIDYNHDGVFGNSEWTQINLNSVTNGLASHTFTLPADAYNGLTGMRVRSRSNGVSNDSTAACTGFSTGETEDFLITITGGGTIGLSDYVSKTEVSIFPNPSAGSFTIETKAANTTYLIEVSDMLGHLVLSGIHESAAGKIHVDLKASAGVYFIKGINILNRSAFTKKIVIE